MGFEVIPLRRFLCFIALLSLVFAGPVQGMRAPVTSQAHDCMCGCGTTSEGSCPCGMPMGPTGGSGSAPSSNNCPRPSSHGTTHSATSQFLDSRQRQDSKSRLSAPKREPAPWPLAAQTVGLRVVLETASNNLIDLGFRSSPPWRSNQRLAALSVFRI